MKRFLLLVLASWFSVSPTLAAQRIKELVSIGGVRPNQLVGYGLVVGLDGSGTSIVKLPELLQADSLLVPPAPRIAFTRTL